MYEAARLIGVQVYKWPGNCSAIAILFVEHKLVKGRAVYGHYHGPVHPKSMFPYEQPFHRHGWVLMDDGRVLDPTRWVFEFADPYVYIGPNNDEYDEGMNSLRTALLKRPPSPEETFSSVGEHTRRKVRVHRLSITPPARERLDVLLTTGRLPDGAYTEPQLFWIANLPYQMLEPYNKEVYDALNKMGFQAWIPYDNWERSRHEGAGNG